MKRRPSITDIAAEAGVSTATASLALRDKGRMSQETRGRVKATAGRLGYVPNATARSLVGGRTQLISISMPAISEAPGMVSSVAAWIRSGPEQDPNSRSTVIFISPPTRSSIAWRHRGRRRSLCWQPSRSTRSSRTASTPTWTGAVTTRSSPGSSWPTARSRRRPKSPPRR